MILVQLTLLEFKLDPALLGQNFPLEGKEMLRGNQDFPLES